MISGSFAEPGEVAPGDAKHLALLELAQTRQRGAEVGRGQQRLEPPVHLIAQPLLAPGKLQHFRLQFAEPIGPRHEQIAERLGTAEERGEDTGLLNRQRLQRRAGACGREQIEEVLGPLRVSAALDGIRPDRILHALERPVTAG